MMLNDRQKSEIDQALALLADVWPAALFRFYTNCVEAGFSAIQAMDLTQTLLHIVVPINRLE